MGFACRCVVWGRVREGFDRFCLQVCCVGQGEGGLQWVLPAGVLCGAG